MAVLVGTTLHAQNIYSVVTCPGEDASHSVNVSWAADTTAGHSVVEYTTLKDRGWRKSLTVEPSLEQLCEVFDSVYSKRADGTDFYEDARFTKCGAVIGGLRSDREYKYRIRTTDGSVSGEYRFKTAGAEKWSAVIISDFHLYPPLRGRVRAGMGMVDTIIGTDKSVDWVLDLGDVCAWGGSWSFWRELYEEPVFNRYMWAGLNGNHDNMTRKSRLTNDFFRWSHYVPRNGYEGEEGVCYHFRYGDMLFIMLNNENMRSDEGLEAAQKWFREVITTEKSSSNPPAFTVVCEHYQWFNGDGKAAQYRRWSELFDEMGVDLALAGNSHIYVRTGKIFEGGKQIMDAPRGTVYLQTTSSDNERGSEMSETLSANEDLIEYRFSEGGKTVSGVHMSVDKHTVTLSLLDRNGKLLDRVKIYKTADRD